MNDFKKMRLNENLIKKKTLLIQKESLKVNRIQLFKKYFYYGVGITIPCLYFYYLLKSTGMFKKLEVDKKYTQRKKKIEESHGIDTKVNDQKIKEFEEKWAINKAQEDYEERLKYGNKELNKREEPELEIKLQEISSKTENVINLEQPQTNQSSNPLQVESNIFFDPRLDNINKK
jgi:hypothetical protein